MLSNQIELKLSDYSDLYDLVIPKNHILREIKEIIDAPSAVIKEALEQRISELEKETARLDQIIKEATEYIETLR